jgi:hypothetical protein
VSDTAVAWERNLTQAEILTAMLTNAEAKMARIARESGADVSEVSGPLRKAIQAASKLAKRTLAIPEKPEPVATVVAGSLPEPEIQSLADAAVAWGGLYGA